MRPIRLSHDHDSAMSRRYFHRFRRDERRVLSRETCLRASFLDRSGGSPENLHLKLPGTRIVWRFDGRPRTMSGAAPPENAHLNLTACRNGVRSGHSGPEKPHLYALPPKIACFFGHLDEQANAHSSDPWSRNTSPLGLRTAALHPRVHKSQVPQVLTFALAAA